ncbi:MAG: FAD-binding protein [Cytophagales bacterium]|nr:FAD-binding protein [Cytophagales bacterium]MDW8385260.1 FAD-binding protein [Flammeovirgaceae bacterium]
MRKLIELVVPPAIGFQEDLLYAEIARKERLTQPFNFQILHRSIDARNRQIKINIRGICYIDEIPAPLISYSKKYPNVTHAKRVIIVGCGPAGMFAALRLIELGFKPIILERGKDVRSRRRDIAAINKEHIVNPDSNYCFGEGGAGTYSDGKLYTRSKKRGNFRRILEIFVAHGASPLILAESHPHIGTNKLPKIIAEMRESILQAGGEIHFETRVTDFILQNNRIKGVIANDTQWEGEAVLLATGHSARDIFELLQKRKIYIESKPFALGVRVEHPQEIINQAQYHGAEGYQYLPAASYSLVSQVAYRNIVRGVFSFCMCPGGFIVPAATQPGEIVVNGMSPSRRDSRFANSGIVVAVENDELLAFQKYGAFASLRFQQQIERLACQIAGNTQTAPAQRLVDFIEGKLSTTLPTCSYQPGLKSVQLTECLPPQIYQRLRIGLKQFGKKLKGFLTNEAILVGVESRTSSPIRIPRDPHTLEHPHIERLFPCGEGAGYAGGIASAAMDGERCAEAIAQKI